MHYNLIGSKKVKQITNVFFSIFLISINFAQEISHNPNPPQEASKQMHYLNFPEAITITQSSDPLNITSGNSVACGSSGTTAHNSYFRAFTLSSFGINNPFMVSSVQFGIESAISAVGYQPITINLYAGAPGFPTSFPGSFTLIGTITDIISTPQYLTLYSFNVSGTVAMGQQLVVEISVPDGQAQGNSFFFGSNNAGQIAPSYFLAADCGISVPTDLSSIGYPNMHLVMSITGDEVLPGTITLSSPNGGENWAVGSSQNISWTSINVTNVRLEYTTNNGTNWISITGSTPSDGAYSWTVPNTPSTQCKVRISDVTDPTTFDLSNNVFIISSNTVQSDYWYPTTGLGRVQIENILICTDGNIFAGTDGGIYKSTNEGDLWRRVGSNLFDKRINSLAYNSNGHIFASTTSETGGVYLSTDNGNSWFRKANGLYNETVNEIAIKSNGHLFAGTVSGIFRSTDNGDNWLRVSFISGIYCISINTQGYIFAGGEFNLYYSMDNGDNWNDISIMGSAYTLSVYSLAINSNGYVFAGTEEGVYRSNDNGANWINLISGLNELFISEIAINSSDHIFVGTIVGGVYRSTNNGNDWILMSSSLSDISVTSIAISQNQTIFVGTTEYFPFRQDGIFRSTNNGSTWSQVNVGLSDHSVWSITINSNDHMFVGTSNNGIFRSLDNGATWVNVKQDEYSWGYKLEINSIGHIFAGVYYDGVFRSTDNGDSWEQVNTYLTYKNVNDLAINSSDHIFAAIEEFGIYRSTDNANTWLQINSGLTNLYVNSLFTSMNGSVFAGTDGGIFKSTNNGDSWELKNSGLSNQTILTFAGNSLGHVFAGTMGGIFRSTDGGENWLQINNGLSGLVTRCIVIDSEDHIFMGGSSVYRSIDNGDNWVKIEDGLYSTPLSLAVNSNNKIFAGTTGAGVFYLTEVPTSVDYFQTLTLSNFTLQQNYPNPFNSATAIQYSIPHRCNVTLKVYDILGKEVTTLVNEEKDQGVYTINFDANNLASGLYLYRIQAGSFVETKKMILMK